MSLALRDAVLLPDDTFFDYGCGHGEDVEFLNGMGFKSDGWDPVHRTAGKPRPASVVNLGYVLNVIEDAEERLATLRRAFELSTGVLVVSALIGYGAASTPKAVPYADGHVTSRNTFQKYFQQDELAEYIATGTGAHPYAAGIGTFYIFKDSQREAVYCKGLLEDSGAGSSALKAAKGSYQLHPDVLQQIASAVRELGRLPLPQELPDASSAIAILAYSDDWLGRLSDFLSVEEVNAVRHARRGVVLRELVGSYFSDIGRMRLSDMTATLSADVRAMFGSISRAYREAEELIGRVFQISTIGRAAQEWGHGKITPDGLYFHTSLEERLPFDLALVVAAGRKMAGEAVSDKVSLVKIGTRRLTVSFGEYARFDDDAHPALGRSIRSDFESGQVASRDYSDSASPPILHRKELLVGPDYPLYDKFRKLSAAEERLGLLGRRDIGTLGAWARLLKDRGVSISGHTLRRRRKDEGGEAVVDQVDDGALLEHVLGDIDGDEHVYKTTRVAVGESRASRERWTPEIVEVLVQGMLRLGRPPIDGEVGLPETVLKRFQDIRDWQRVLGTALDLNLYEDVRRQRWSEWIVRLGTARFSGREAYRRMSASDQADVRYLFGSYRQACIEADQWLFRIGKPEEIEEAIRSWPFGRHHEEKGLYVHRSLEDRLPVLLRLLINCGRHLASDALPTTIDVMRVALDGRNVKFYAYEDFDTPGPSQALQTAKVDFRRRRVIARQYTDDRFPKTIEVKHDLVDSAHPLRDAFLAAEMSKGLAS